MTLIQLRYGFVRSESARVVLVLAAAYADQVNVTEVESTVDSVTLRWQPPSDSQVCSVDGYVAKCRFRRCGSTSAAESVDRTLPADAVAVTIADLEAHLNVSCVVVITTSSGAEYSGSAPQAVQTSEMGEWSGICDSRPLRKMSGVC